MVSSPKGEAVPGDEVPEMPEGFAEENRTDYPDNELEGGVDDE